MVMGMTRKCAPTGRDAHRFTHTGGNRTADHNHDQGERRQASSHLIREYKPTPRMTEPAPEDFLNNLSCRHILEALPSVTPAHFEVHFREFQSASEGPSSI